ncbi:MAG: DNA repair protein RecO [Holosporales bacterium]
MEWRDAGIILDLKHHGESHLIVSLLSPHQGRVKGLWRSGAKKRHALQGLSVVDATWRARLPEHLGEWKFEILRTPFAAAFDDPFKLLALKAAVSLCEQLLPEREPHPRVYEALLLLAQNLEYPHWWLSYLDLERALIREAGIPLEFEGCAVTGQSENLAYVSPRTGRAVVAAAAEPYMDKLIPLPQFWSSARAFKACEQPTFHDILRGLDLTGYFLARYALEVHHLNMPQARIDLVDRVRAKTERNQREP